MKIPASFACPLPGLGRLLVPLLLASSCPVAFAANYPASSSQGFTFADGLVPGVSPWNDGSALSSTAVGSPPVPVASVRGNALRLAADGVPGTTTSFKLPEIDTGLDISALNITFTVKLFSSGVPGNGFSVNFGDIPLDDGDGELGYPLPRGLVVAWDTFVDPAAGETQGEIVVYADRIKLATYPQTFVNDSVARAVLVHWDAQGLDLKWDLVDLAVNLPVPGFVPGVGDRVAFCARTGAEASQEIAIDTLQVQTTPVANIVTGGPVITEFVADNSESFEDEDTDSPDWLEIVNGSAAPASVAGWFLTNDPADKTKWPLPAVTLAANAYRVVFASGKNRSSTSAAAQWHTNFTLLKEGGYLALVRPDLTLASEFTYGPQAQDVAYGEIGAARQRGFLETPTPGKKNVSLLGDGPPAEEVVFSRDGGLLSNADPVPLTIAPVAAPGAVVRYTLNNTVPTGISPVYGVPFSITNTTTIRARVFEPGKLPGAVSSRTFLKLDPSLTNFNASGQVFSSNLPVLVFDSFGVGVDGATSSGARPFRPSYSVVIAPDPATGRARLDGAVDFQGRAGTHVRGESSAGFSQKSYSWELWTNENLDKDAAILGLPAESDWALLGPWSEKTLIRNYLVFSTFGALHSDYFAPRTRLVEVFFNQEANQPVSYNDYRGVYLLVERIKRSTNRVDVARINPLVSDPVLQTGGYIFKTDKLNTGSGRSEWTTNRQISMQSADPDTFSPTQKTYLQGYINAFETALYGANFANPLTGYAAQIDVPGFIDAQWAVEISKQVDGYVFSTYYHKDRAGKMRAGPLWDFNISLGNADYATGDTPTGWLYDTAGTAPLGGGLWYARLHADPNYRVRTFDRYWEIRNSLWSTTAIQGRIDAATTLLLDGNATNVTNNTPAAVQNPAARHFRKHKILGVRHWPNPAEATSRTSFQSEIAAMKQWITTRLDWIDNQFSLGSAAMRPPVVTQSDAGTGTVQVSLAPFAGSAPGVHFSDGTIYFTTDGSDPRPTGYPLPTVQNLNLLPEYGQASWFVPTADNGGLTLPLEEWTGVTEPPNPGLWTPGQLGIGFDTAGSPLMYHTGGAHPADNTWTGGASNLQAAMLNVSAAAFVRMPFTLTADQRARLVSLKVKVRYEDGFVVFINGTEATRKNIAASSVAAWNATADTAPANLTDTTGATGVTIDISQVINRLQAGPNMLAVLALNKTAADTDFLCAPSLTGSLGVRPASAPVITAAPYVGPLTLSTSTTVKARLFVPETGMWSPLANSTQIVAAVPASKDNLVVSEINYAPLPPTAAEMSAGAGASSDLEFIELLNTSGDTVDLTDVRLTGGVGEFNFTHGDPLARTVPPGGRVIVCGNLPAFRARYTNPAIRVAGEFSGNLNNAGDSITLLDKTGAVLWSFDYDDVEPWPVVDNGSGSSIVLNNPTRHPAPDPTLGASWRPSAAAHGNPGEADSTPFTLAPNLDDDGDGVANLLEHIAGTDAANPSSSAAPSVSLGDAGGPGSPIIELGFPRNLAADDFTLAVETSADLLDWNPATGLVYAGIRRDANGRATVVWRTEPPAVPDHAPVFFRLVAGGN